MSIENPLAGQSEEEFKNNPAEQTPETPKTPEHALPESDDMIIRAREIAKKKKGTTSLTLEDLGAVLHEATQEKTAEQEKTKEILKNGKINDSEGNTEFWEHGRMYAKKYADGRFLKFKEGEGEKGEEGKATQNTKVHEDTSTHEKMNPFEQERTEDAEKRREQNIEKAVDKAKEILLQTERQKVKKFRRKKAAVIIPEDGGIYKKSFNKDEATEAKFREINPVKSSHEAVNPAFATGLSASHEIKEKKKSKQKERQEKTPEDPEKATTAGFEKIFGIKEEELNAIEGYASLSEGQRRLVLQNMESMALMHTKVEAAKQYKEETAKASFFPKVVRSILKNFYLAETEKEVVRTAKARDKEANLRTLEDLTRMTKESGIDAHFEKRDEVLSRTLRSGEGSRTLIEKARLAKRLAKGPKSVLVIDYAGRMEGLTEQEQAVVDRFNDVARRLAEGDTRNAGRGLKLDIANNLLENEYATALDDLMTIKKGGILRRMDFEKASWRDEYTRETLLEMMRIDKRVRMNQFFSENPKVEEELNKITSKPFWTKALKNTTLERGGYMALGYGGRAALAGALGVFAAPLVAAGSGGFMARKRAVENLNEEFRAAKLGKKSALMEKMSGNTEKQKIQAAERIKSGKYSGETILAGKAYVEANTLAEKIEKTIERINMATDEKERAHLLNILDQRLYYTRYVLDNRLVGFSGKDAQLSEQYELLSKLAEGEVAVQMGDKEVNEKIKERLASVLRRKAGHTDTARTKHVWKETLKGAALGAGLAFLGGEINQWWRGGGTETVPHTDHVLPQQQVSHAPALKTSGNPFAPDYTVVHNKTPYVSIKNTPAPQDTVRLPSQFQEVPDTTRGIQNTLKGVVPLPKTGGNTPTEIISSPAPNAPTNLEATIGKGGNIWNSARELAKKNHVDFEKAWSDPHSVFRTPDGKLVPLSRMGLVVEGDKVAYVPHAGGHGGHFELIDTSREAKSDAALYDIILKKKGHVPGWLRASVLHDQPPEKVLEGIEAKGIEESQPLREIFHMTPRHIHSTGFEEVVPKGTTMIPRGGTADHIFQTMKENTQSAHTAPHHEIAKSLAETRPGGGIKGGEYFSKDFESKLVAYANSHGKKLDLLRGNAIMEGKKLTHNIGIYEKMRANPFETKHADGLLRRIKIQLNVIAQNYGDIIDKKILPKDLR